MATSPIFAREALERPWGYTLVVRSWLLTIPIAAMLGVIAWLSPARGYAATEIGGADGVQFHAHEHTHDGSTHSHGHSHIAVLPSVDLQDVVPAFTSLSGSDDDHCCSSLHSHDFSPRIALREKGGSTDQLVSVSCFTAPSQLILPLSNWNGPARRPPPDRGPPPHISPLRTIVLLT